MKKSILLTGLCAILLFACKKKEDNVNAVDNNPKWETQSGPSDMMIFLKAHAPEFNPYTIDASTGGYFKNDDVMVIIPMNSFVSANGSPYTGMVSLQMQTIRTIKDMIYSGVTTVAGNGELLISDGMFKLEAYDANNNKLKLKPGASYTVRFPAYNDNNLLFSGQEGSGTNKVEWEEWDSMGIKRFGDSSIVSGIDSLFKYVNLDRYMNATPLTDITINTPAGFTNKNTECFIRYAGENASAYVPSNVSLKAFSTVGAGYKVVEGKSIKVICFAKRNGKFYYQVKTIGSITTNQVLAMDNMTETTEANLQSVITAF
jgi:hypothetical protein